MQGCGRDQPKTIKVESLCKLWKALYKCLFKTTTTKGVRGRKYLLWISILSPIKMEQWGCPPAQHSLALWHFPWQGRVIHPILWDEMERLAHTITAISKVSL